MRTRVVDRMARVAMGDRLENLQRRLNDLEAEVQECRQLNLRLAEVTDVVDHGFIRSIYFTDPNGIALEASWWTLDATGRSADYGDERLFGDPPPVPAVDELRDSGRLSSVPQTRLV